MPDIPRSKTWLVLAGTIVLQIAIIRSSTVLRHELHPRPHSIPNVNGSIDLISQSNFYRRTGPEGSTQIQQTFLTLPYSEWYAASSPALKPLIATGYLLLLSFLFSFIGIVASDFFCPNLATISNYLGLSETTAGVTLLAFGNGSPDVFSTFSAMNQGTFSLAIGELIGAATFITSIVVGSIAFIRPFHVPKTAFIRDITFFTAAVIVLVVVLRDGHLTLVESATMVALYALYVVVVVTMNVMAQRGRRRLPDSPPEMGDHGEGWKSLPGSGGLSPLSPLATNGNVNGVHSSPGRLDSLQLPSPHLEEPPHESDEGSSTGTLTPTGHGPTRSRRQSGSGSGSRSRSRSHSQAHQYPHQHQHLHMHLQGLSTPDYHHHNHNHYPETPRANFSLLGAVEFRDVVNSLKREQELSSSRAPSPSRSPYTAAERGDYFSAAAPTQGSSGGHRRSVSHAATRRSSTQYRSRAISHVVHPGSMATFTMPPAGVAPVSPKRASPTRTKSAPGPVSPGSIPNPKSGAKTGAGDQDHSPKKQTTDPTSDSSSGLSPHTVISPPSENPWTFQSGHPSNPPRPALPKLAIPEPVLPPKRRPGHGATPSISVVDPSGHIEEPIFSPPRDGASPPIRLTDLGPGSIDASTTPHESRWRIRRRIRKTLRVLFPSLQSLRHKSLFGKILSVYSVPAIFVLTLTLPVVDDGNREEGGIVLPEGEDEPLVPGLNLDLDLEPGRYSDQDDMEERDEQEEGDPFLRPDVGEGLHQLVEGGFSPLHSPLGRIHQSQLANARRAEAEEEQSDGDWDGEGRVSGEEDEEIEKGLMEEMEEEQALQFNKSLCAAQCVLGPTFCSYIVFGDLDSGPWITLGCFIAGLVAAIASIHFGTDGTSKTWRLVRTLAGFTCSMVWIAAIADEVVSVLQSIGELMGLSDAIIGLTIFAIGNSMADLVANITVAQFAPAMAYAACFGGPMLNLLLGVGGSGTYHLLTHPHHPVNLHFSPTLWVSATGLIIILLTTAIVVPLNGYLIDRRWAGCLVLAYGVLMVTNVVVEVKTGRA